MQTFRDFCAQKYGAWPPADLADAVADYLDPTINPPQSVPDSPPLNIRHSTPPPMPDSRRRPRA